MRTLRVLRFHVHILFVCASFLNMHCDHTHKCASAHTHAVPIYAYSRAYNNLRTQTLVSSLSCSLRFSHSRVTSQPACHVQCVGVVTRSHRTCIRRLLRCTIYMCNTIEERYKESYHYVLHVYCCLPSSHLQAYLLHLFL